MEAGERECGNQAVGRRSENQGAEAAATFSE